MSTYTDGSTVDTTDTPPLLPPEQAIDAARERLLHVPDELREQYDLIDPDDIERQMLDSGAEHGGAEGVRALAFRIARHELGHPREPSRVMAAAGRTLDTALSKHGQVERAEQVVDDRARLLEREVRRARLAGEVQVHDERLRRAGQAAADAVRRAEIHAFERDRNTDPVTGSYDTPLHGGVVGRSIMPGRFVPTDGAWHSLVASELVHMLAAHVFAQRVLERDPQLAAAVEARVQRMLDESGLPPAAPASGGLFGRKGGAR